MVISKAEIEQRTNREYWKIISSTNGEQYMKS